MGRRNFSRGPPYRSRIAVNGETSGRLNIILTAQHFFAGGRESGTKADFPLTEPPGFFPARSRLSGREKTRVILSAHFCGTFFIVALGDKPMKKASQRERERRKN